MGARGGSTSPAFINLKTATALGLAIPETLWATPTSDLAPCPAYGGDAVQSGG
jgi:hypothetical protein